MASTALAYRRSGNWSKYGRSESNRAAVATEYLSHPVPELAKSKSSTSTKLKHTPFISCSTRYFRLIKNPHRIAMGQWGWKIIPIPTPYPYPWGSPYPRQPWKVEITSAGKCARESVYAREARFLEQLYAWASAHRGKWGQLTPLENR